MKTEEEKKKKEEDIEEEGMVKEGSSSHQKEWRKKETSEFPEKMSARNLVKYFENFETSSTSEPVQISGGNFKEPISNSAGILQLSDWTDKSLCSGNSILRGEEPNQSED